MECFRLLDRLWESDLREQDIVQKIDFHEINTELSGIELTNKRYRMEYIGRQWKQKNGEYRERIRHMFRNGLNFPQNNFGRNYCQYPIT